MRRFNIILLLALCGYLSSRSQIVLNGRVITDDSSSVPNTKIGVAGGQSDNTDSKGQFSIKLSIDFIEGERVILIVFKDRWVINHPLDGEWDLPNVKYQNVHTTKVIIVPYGSKKLWSHGRIEKLLGLLSDEIIKRDAQIARLEKEASTPKSLDFTFALKEWASKYGFTPKEVKGVFDEWAEEVKEATDYRTLGLRAFYEMNLKTAAENFGKAYTQGVEKKNAISLENYQNAKDAGNSFYKLYFFDSALVWYQRAEKEVSRADYPREWVRTKVLIGDAARSIGERAESPKSNQMLSYAVESHNEALQACNREKFPEEWATTQNELGIATMRLAWQAGGERSEELIKNGLQALLSAQEVFTRENFPYQWGTSQINIGNVLASLAKRAVGVEGKNLSTAAAAAYSLALEVDTLKRSPELWSIAMNNLGIVLYEYADRSRETEEGKQFSIEALRVLRLALEVRARKPQFVQEKAETQVNLGNALRIHSLYADKEDEKRGILKEAATMFRLALEVYSREGVPQRWAATQNNLGLVLSDQATHTTRESARVLLKEAIQAYRHALEVRTQKDFPEDWAGTQDNLGAALRDQAARTSGQEAKELLKEAIQASMLALEVYTRDQYLPDWALTQKNLAKTYVALGLWKEAAECYSNASKVRQYREDYESASSLYQNKLFDFSKAYDLDSSWADEHWTDVNAQCRFVERQFTTARFNECKTKLGEIHFKVRTETLLRLPIEAIGVANALALGETEDVPMDLELMADAIAAQPEAFKLDWDFAGTKHFISNHQSLAPYRDWLLRLFSALEEKKRDRIVEGLKRSKAEFEQMAKTKM